LDRKYDTWEGVSHMNCPQRIEEYEQRMTIERSRRNAEEPAPQHEVTPERMDNTSGQ
jgi:hypothetical protein